MVKPKEIHAGSRVWTPAHIIKSGPWLTSNLHHVGPGYRDIPMGGTVIEVGGIEKSKKYRVRFDDDHTIQWMTKRQLSLFDKGNDLHWITSAIDLKLKNQRAKGKNVVPTLDLQMAPMGANSSSDGETLERPSKKSPAPQSNANGPHAPPNTSHTLGDALVYLTGDDCVTDQPPT